MRPAPHGHRSLAMTNIAKWQERDARRRACEAKEREEQRQRQANHEAFMDSVRMNLAPPLVRFIGDEWQL